MLKLGVWVPKSQIHPRSIQDVLEYVLIWDVARLVGAQRKIIEQSWPKLMQR